MADLSIISLCAGIGGLDESIRIAVPTARVICRVEREAYCVEVMARRDEEEGVGPVPCWSDLRTFDGRRWRGCVDILAAGYPCQPFSFAGRRGGSDDPRHLWPHVARVVEEIQPGVCFFENVAGHLSLGFDVVWGDLRRMGYRVAAGLFTAAEVGAPHKRTRLFILAIRDDAGPGAREQGEQGEQAGHGRHRLADDGLELADAQGRGRGELRESSRGHGQSDRGDLDVADAELSGTARQRGHMRTGLREEAARPGTGCNGMADAARHGGCRCDRQGGSGRGVCEVCRAMADTPGDGRRIDQPERRQNRRTADIEAGGERLPIFPPGPGDIDGWQRILAIDPTLEPAVCRVAHGIPNRLDRLRALGNGVVPLEGAYAFVSLWACLNG